MKTKILTVLGTRPEAIKMAPVLVAMKEDDRLESLLCVTGQHRDILRQALETLELQPDLDLDVMTPGQSLSQLTANCLTGVTQALHRFQPHRVLVHGDTTTSLAGALAAFYAGVPVGHVEAGLRTGDINSPFPEEFNRITVDVIADLLWAPTQGAADALLREGRRPTDILVTGNTAVDALKMSLRKIDEDAELGARLDGLFHFIDPDLPMILVTGHRRESFDSGLAQVCRTISEILLRGEAQVVWPIHPNPAVRSVIDEYLPAHQNLHLLDPQNYFEFIHLMRLSHVIVSDSGGIQEEAPTLRKPVLITRFVTERPEAVAAGCARLVGTDQASLTENLLSLLRDKRAYEAMTTNESPFGDGQAARRIVESIVERHARPGR